MLASSIDFNVLFHDNHQLMMIYEMNTLQLLEANEAACQHYGYTRNELLQLTIRDIRPVDAQDELDKALKELTGGRSTKRTVRHLKKDGSLIYVDVITHDIMFDNKPSRLAMLDDVTEKKLHELQLQKALVQMEHTLASISDGFFAVDNQGIVITWNKSAEVLTGVNPNSILNKNFWDIIPAAANSSFRCNFEQAVKSNSCTKFEEYFKRTDKWFYCSIYPSTEGVSVYFQNITEIKKHQQELKIKNQHLESVAYFNSHELRRPVANILGLYPLLLSSDAPGTESKEEVIEKVYRSCQDIDQVIKKIDKTHFAG